VEYEPDEARDEIAVSRAGDMGSGFLVRDVDLWVGVDVGIVIDGLLGLFETVLEAMERESWSVLPVADSGEP